MTEENLKTAANMFIYLITCPESIKPWILFYKDLFTNQSPDQILLTLNRIMKGTRTQQNTYFKNLASYFFKNLSNLFSKKFDKNKRETKGKSNTKNSSAKSKKR